MVSRGGKTGFNDGRARAPGCSGLADLGWSGTAPFQTRTGTNCCLLLCTVEDMLCDMEGASEPSHMRVAQSRMQMSPWTTHSAVSVLHEGLLDSCLPGTVLGAGDTPASVAEAPSWCWGVGRTQIRGFVQEPA